MSDSQEEDGNLRQDFLLMSDQSDDSAPLGGLGQDRILDVNLNLDLPPVDLDLPPVDLDLPPVDLDLPPVDLGLGALQCMGFGIGKFFGETSRISMAISF